MAGMPAPVAAPPLMLNARCCPAPPACPQVQRLSMSDLPTAPLAEVQVLQKSSTAGFDKGELSEGGAVSLAGRGATFKSQAGALYRKNAVFQRRNWGSTVFDVTYALEKVR